MIWVLLVLHLGWIACLMVGAYYKGRCDEMERR